MAIDVYLQIDGIKGESTDSSHQGWIEVSQAQWGVTQPISSPGSGAGGRTTGRSEYRSMSLAKLADLASPGAQAVHVLEEDDDRGAIGRSRPPYIEATGRRCNGVAAEE